MPRERGKATRVELRVGDGAANPYLATAAALFAGLDGIKRKLRPPRAGGRPDLRAARRPRRMTPLPRTFEAALEALDADDLIKESMGEELVATFLEIKNFELERSHRYVTDWEWREYTHHL